jgi:hypothetical protein
MNLQCNACGTKFRSAIAEARHRHNFPALCKRNAAFTLFIAQTEADAAKERVKTLEYQLSEVLGCLDEYAAMPCTSLRVRLVEAGARARSKCKIV